MRVSTGFIWKKQFTICEKGGSGYGPAAGSREPSISIKVGECCATIGFSRRSQIHRVSYNKTVSNGQSYFAIAPISSESLQKEAKHSPLFAGNKYQGYMKKENRLCIL
jgi:hypothetical protein